jgi:hypothetical protein
MKMTHSGLLVLGLLTLILFSLSAGAETLNYQVIKKYKDFEVRRYPSYLVAEVEAGSDFDAAAYISFRQLFNYIDGNNIKHENIAMTSPVSQEGSSKSGEKITMTSPVVQEASTKSSEKIAMTSPVVQETGAGKSAGKSYRVGFSMPEKYNISNIPKPLDPEVKIREVPERLVAARTYSGSWSKSKFEKNEKILLEAIKKEGLITTGTPVFARYNHPMTLPWNRHNEVLIEIKS